jgi:hypothetical protein
MNQNRPSEASKIKTIGTTIAGINVERFEDEVDAGVEGVGLAEAFDCVTFAVVEADKAAADVREA